MIAHMGQKGQDGYYAEEGKHLVFAMTIKLIPEFLRNQAIPEKYLEKVCKSETGFFPGFFYLFLILFLIS